ncbi:CDGSH iron-sulfur domain-containing protein [Streptomyces sp. NPDC059788]|uniref:CDGSH iron-sulfur domain-containing protein n=1 Tax=Streptomyces sp. NPDC059788 TaxID=3346948 RepID=UPI0036470050
MPSGPREQESVPRGAYRVRGEARRVVQDPAGPVLVEGPVEVRLGDGTTARSDRPLVALCRCRRSRTFPWCDTSHRGRGRSPAARRAAGDAERGARAPDSQRGEE